MNEKIKELAEQADEYAWKQFPDTSTYPDPTDWQVIRDNKFAELIIQKCIDVHKDDYGIDIIGDALRDYFGAE